MIDVSSGRPIALISELFRFVRRTQISIMIRSASLAVLLLCPCFAQAPLTFEVAPIKLADPDAKGSQIRFMPGGGVNITNVPVRAVRKASPRRWRCWRKSYSNTMGRPVVDKTSLLGKYDFVLEWTPEVGVAPGGSTIFTALQEQLGLRLDSQKGPVENTVIDRVEKPSEN